MTLLCSNIDESLSSMLDELGSECTHYLELLGQLKTKVHIDDEGDILIGKLEACIGHLRIHSEVTLEKLNED